MAHALAGQAQAQWVLPSPGLPDPLRHLACLLPTDSNRLLVVNLASWAPAEGASLPPWPRFDGGSPWHTGRDPADAQQLAARQAALDAALLCFPLMPHLQAADVPLPSLHADAAGVHFTHPSELERIGRFTLLLVLPLLAVCLGHDLLNGWGMVLLVAVLVAWNRWPSAAGTSTTVLIRWERALKRRAALHGAWVGLWLGLLISWGGNVL